MIQTRPVSIIEPMECLKQDRPFSSSDYLYEPKIDGWRCRMVNYIGNGQVVKIDGEVAVLDADGVPRLNLVQQRGRSDPLYLSWATKEYPALFFAFDILECLDTDVSMAATIKRKHLLSEVWPMLPNNGERGIRLYSSGGHDITRQFPELRSPGNYRLLDWVIGDGIPLYDKLVGMGWEGMVAKRLSSPYLAGSKTTAWIKVKKPRSEATFIICGAVRGKGNREGLVGSLILGEVRDGQLCYVGEVGSGFSFAALAWFTNSLKRQDACPFSSQPKVEGFWFWCAPESKLEVDFYERTKDSLREPVAKPKRILWR